jgi:hypothetical protein
MAAEWVAPGKPPHAEPPTAHDAMEDHGIAHVVSARGLEPTGAGKQR